MYGCNQQGLVAENSWCWSHDNQCQNPIKPRLHNWKNKNWRRQNTNTLKSFVKFQETKLTLQVNVLNHLMLSIAQSFCYGSQAEVLRGAVVLILACSNPRSSKNTTRFFALLCTSSEFSIYRIMVWNYIEKLCYFTLLGLLIWLDNYSTIFSQARGRAKVNLHFFFFFLISI